MSYFDDNDDSPAIELWRERVDSYLDGQEGVEALRRRIQPNPPWPEADNPMLGYLIARALEGLLHERVTSDLACLEGGPGRMLLCRSPFLASSATTSCA